MENLVIIAVNLWSLAHKEELIRQHWLVHKSLTDELERKSHEFYSWASYKSRGVLLPAQTECLDTLWDKSEDVLGEIIELQQLDFWKATGLHKDIFRGFMLRRN